MSQEQIFADFSGGMNALAAVDKLDPKECLVAENVRLDETGDVQSAGAMTAQNTVAYQAAPTVIGTGTVRLENVHSLFWNPAIGAVAGIGKDVFFGPTLGGMTDTLTASNASQQKMSFTSAPGKVYFDVGSVGYWTDMSKLLTVDWQSPIAIGNVITGPTIPGTCVETGGFTSWTTPGQLVSTNSNTPASITLASFGAQSNFLRATMTTSSFAVGTAPVTGVGVTLVVMATTTASDAAFAEPEMQLSLIKNGSPVGDIRGALLTTGAFAPGVFQTYTAGGSDILWNLMLAQADVNAGNFGFQLQFVAESSLPIYPQDISVYGAEITIYQGGGFAAGTGTTGTLTGTYSYKITFVATDGEESDASNESNAVTLAAQQGTITAIQTGDSRTVARNVYRLGGLLTSHYLVGTINDNISTTYSDNQTDLAALSEGVILPGDVPGDYPNSRLGSVPVRFPELHYDRVFWVNQNKPNQIIWSKPLNGFAYPSVNFIDVGDANEISRIASIFGELIIIKTNGIWRLTGTDESSFDLTQTPSAVGTDLSFTVVKLPDKIVFTNRYGIWVFNGYTSVPLTNKLDTWFKQLNRTNVSLFSLTGFYPPEVADATVPLKFDAVGNSEKYCLTYAETGISNNNTILLFDLKHGNITKRCNATSILIAHLYSLAIDPVNGFIYVGDDTGTVSLLDDWNGTKQLGLNTNLDFQTGYFDLQRGSNKALWALEFFINTSGQSITPYVYYDNGSSSEALAPIVTTSLQRVVRPLTSTASRKMQNFSVRINGTLTTVNNSGTPTVRLVHIKTKFDIRAGRAREGQ